MTKSDWIYLLSAIIVWLIFSLWNILLPGLQYDECLAAAPAVNFVTNTYNTEPMQINPSVIEIFGRKFPIMIMTYIGPVKTLLHIPIYFILGISVFTTRLLPILIVIFSFPLIYLLCKNLFNSQVARFSIFLIALDPSFTFYLTRDVGPAVIPIFLKLFSLLYFYKWWYNHKLIYWIVANFSLGLGISHKVDFLWIVVGIYFSAVIILRSKIFTLINLRHLFYGMLSIIIGALPITLFNIVTTGYTFSPFLSIVSISLNSIILSINERFHQILTMLSGEHISLLYTQTRFENLLFKYFVPLIFCLSLITNLMVVVSKKERSDKNMIIGLILFIIIVFFESLFSPTTLGGHHLLALYPFIHVLIGLFINNITNIGIIKKYKIQYVLITFILLINVFNQITINKNFERTGGTGYWSDAIYELNEYLLNKNKRIVLMEWGFTNNLIVLSKGNLVMDRFYREFWLNNDYCDAFKNYIKPDKLFLFHNPGFENYQRAYEIFVNVSNELNLSPKLEKVFYQRDGKPVYQVYSLQ